MSRAQAQTYVLDGLHGAARPEGEAARQRKVLAQVHGLEHWRFEAESISPIWRRRDSIVKLAGRVIKLRPARYGAH